MHPLAVRFAQRFRGLERAYGTYRVGTKTNERGKREGRAKTLRGEVTDQLWIDHLEGTLGLGITPINDVNECGFGAVDIDEYDLNLEHLELAVQEAELPLILCRTKSGGAHLYLFTSEPVPAALMRTKLQNWCVIVGHPNVEVFPKQSEHIIDDEGGSFGSWINLPYFDASRTMRYALRNGEALSLQQFLDYADEIAVSESVLRATKGRIDPDLEGAPPCIQHLARSGVPEGSRNQTLLAMGTYAKMKYGEAWEGKLDDFNHKYFQPPLGSSDVTMVAKGLKKKDYFYKCKEFPLSASCNRTVCRKAKYGLRGSKNDPGITIDGLVKLLTEPPMWYCNVNNKRIKVPSSAELMDQKKFERICIDAHNIVPDRVQDQAWRGIIRGLMDNVEEVPAPEDAGKEGQLIAILHQFFHERNNADNISEVQLGKIFTDSEEKSYFTGSAFMAFCARKKFAGEPQYIWSVVQERQGATYHELTVGGRQVLLWAMQQLKLPEIDFSAAKTVDNPKEDKAF